MKMTTLALAAAALALAFSAADAAPVVSLNPSTSTQLIGGTFSLEVKISGLGNEIVSAFDLNIYFNSSQLRAVSYTLGSGLGGPWDDYGIDPSLPGAPVDYFSLIASSSLVNAGVPGADDLLADEQTDDSFVMLTLNFEAIGSGVSQVWFGDGLNERDVVGRNEAFLSGLQFQDACVAVNSPTGEPGSGNNSCLRVPEPSSYALLGLGLFAAFAPSVARRRKTMA